MGVGQFLVATSLMSEVSGKVENPLTPDTLKAHWIFKQI